MTSTVRVSLESRGDFVGIAVEDDGVGITREDQRRIFRKFTRGEAARALNIKGPASG